MQTDLKKQKALVQKHQKSTWNLSNKALNGLKINVFIFGSKAVF